ncbi:MAG: LPXTG cell wall anchor domain-containing protein [Phycisphaerae bacterium]
MSTWGMAAMTVALLGAALVVLRRRRMVGV